MMNYWLSAFFPYISFFVLQLKQKKNSHPDYVPLVNILGVQFQIRDDYLNLKSDQVSYDYHFLLFSR